MFEICFKLLAPISSIYILFINPRLFVCLNRSQHEWMISAIFVAFVLTNVYLFQFVNVVHLLHCILELPSSANIFNRYVCLGFVLECILRSVVLGPTTKQILKDYWVFHHFSLCCCDSLPYKTSSQDHNDGLIRKLYQFLAVESFASSNSFANLFDDSPDWDWKTLFVALARTSIRPWWVAKDLTRFPFPHRTESSLRCNCI